MADLRDDNESDVPDECRLRLSLAWNRIMSDPDDADLLSARLALGLFIGDQPLFASPVYTDPKDAFVPPGCFYAEDYGCHLLRDIWNTLQTGIRVDFEDTLHPSVRLIIAPDLLRAGPTSDREEWFDVLVIIQHGGPWHDHKMGGAGPAALLVVRREQLARFLYDLLDEALSACNELAIADLKEAFAEPLAARALQR